QRLGRYEEAIAGFKKVMAVSANANGAWVGISQCYRALGKKQQADDAAKMAERVLTSRQRIGNLQHEIQADPNRFDIREQYAETIMETGQYLLAAEQYRYIAVHNPDQPAWWLKA